MDRHNGQNVLLVEDDPDMRELLRITLAERGHRVTACANAESGWEAYQKRPFPLVFLDWMLPDMDGLQLCRNIRGHISGRESVILIITIRTNPGDLEQVMDAGADDYIAKPFSENLLDIRTSIAERIVEQRQSHSYSLSQISALIEAIPDFVCFKDPDGEWLSINSAAKEAFQLEDIPWQGKTSIELIDFIPNLQEIFITDSASDELTWKKSKHYDYDETVIDTKGNQRIYAIRKVPIYKANGEPRCMLVTGRDVTEKRKALDEIVQARDSAEQANLAKSQFLGRMSHELRTPLNAILGFAQIMEMQLDDTPMINMRKNVEQIVTSGWYLTRIINDLLDLSAIEANKIEIHMETVDLHTIVAECIKVMTPLAANHEVKLLCQQGECQDIHITADGFRLKQVMLNLLSNAVKYNRKDGEVRLQCKRIADNRIHIEVIDDGLGIAEADLPGIFEAFSRLHNRRYDIEGAGIGLSITKQLVELMGGIVDVESTLNKGSKFWIELDEAIIQTVTDKEPSGTQSITGSDKDKTSIVLYIEDSPSHTELMRSVFNGMENIELLTAHTPALGLELANVHRPDLILSDICLPGMNGYELLKILKSSELTSHIPVIAISANAMTSEIEAGLLAGFRRYFTKPIHVNEFREEILEVMEDEAVLDHCK